MRELKMRDRQKCKGGKCETGKCNAARRLKLSNIVKLSTPIKLDSGSGANLFSQIQRN